MKFELALVDFIYKFYQILTNGRDCLHDDIILFMIEGAKLGDEWKEAVREHSKAFMDTYRWEGEFRPSHFDTDNVQEFVESCEDGEMQDRYRYIIQAFHNSIE